VIDQTSTKEIMAERNGHLPTLDHAEAAIASRKRAGRRVLALAALAVVAFTGALVAGTLPRLLQTQELNAAAAETMARLTRVTVATARQASADAERALPGTTLPLLEASIYARTTGYVKRRLVDIGDHVQEGQLLAEIATPEIDAQLEQARATLLQTKANLRRNKADEEFARSEENRYRQMVQTGSIGREEYEGKLAASRVATAVVHATEATIKVNQADILRLSTLQSFERVTAPFAGILTARNVDPGDLVTADSPSTGRQMFHLMRTDILRVFVDVPQVFATSVKVGQQADVYRREDPNRLFKGTVTRTADALDFAVIGQSLSFTATVTAVAPAADTPSGTVNFFDGNTLLGTATLGAGGKATLTSVFSTLGGHTIQALYNGDGNFAGSAKTVTEQVVARPTVPASPPAPPSLNVPPLLALLDQLLGGIEMVNANGTEAITDNLFGIPLLVSTFDNSGDLVSVSFFGLNFTFLFV
jgi:RND family efflux transporter MFP subunit